MNDPLLLRSVLKWPDTFFGLNAITLNVHKLVNHPLKILQHLLQNFERVFNRLINARRYKVERSFCITEPRDYKVLKKISVDF